MDAFVVDVVGCRGLDQVEGAELAHGLLRASGFEMVHGSLVAECRAARPPHAKEEFAYSQVGRYPTPPRGHRSLHSVENARNRGVALPNWPDGSARLPFELYRDAAIRFRTYPVFMGSSPRIVIRGSSRPVRPSCRATASLASVVDARGAPPPAAIASPLIATDFGEARNATTSATSRRRRAGGSSCRRPCAARSLPRVDALRLRPAAATSAARALGAGQAGVHDGDVDARAARARRRGSWSAPRPRRCACCRWSSRSGARPGR